MNTFLQLVKAAAGFAVVAIFVLALIALFNGAPSATRSQPLPQPIATSPISPLPTPIVTGGPTPTPYPTPRPPDFTPEPISTSTLPTPGPLIGPQTLYDPVSHFSLTLSPGWYASVPDSHFASVTDIANYNFYTTRRPLDGISIQIQAGPLPSDQSFEQWLADFRVRETSPESGAFGVTLTEPQPHQLGRYEGVTYVATGQEGESVLVLHIPSGDGWIAVISLSPYDASNPPPPALSEALSMLATIQISSQPLR